MHNSDQVRDFFQKMANGLVLNTKTEEENGLNIRRDDSRSQVKPGERASKFSDFGVGLPPLAHS